MLSFSQLDPLDVKILSELDKDCRQSNAQIARKIHSHRNVVGFRIKRLQEKGVIRAFITMISPSALGLTPYKLYLQLQGSSVENEKHLTQFLKTVPVYWAAQASGRWDYIIGFLVKSPAEFNEIKWKLLNALEGKVVKKSVSLLVQSPHYYRSYLDTKKNVSPVKYWIQPAEKKSTIDETDRRLLQLLAANARKPTIELAAKLNLSEKTVLSRMRALEKNSVIYDYRVSIDLSKIGYKFFKCFISLQNASPKQLQTFLDYCQGNPHIIHMVECVGEWDFEPEFEVESYEQFYSIVEEIRSRFSDIIQSIETIDILKEYHYICLPEAET